MNLTEMKSKYEDGMSMEQFVRIDEISCYNNNYYMGLYGDLLFGHSDDDNTTEWWMLQGADKLLLGYSLCSESEKLIKSDTIWT